MGGFIVVLMELVEETPTNGTRPCRLREPPVSSLVDELYVISQKHFIVGTTTHE